MKAYILKCSLTLTAVTAFSILDLRAQNISAQKGAVTADDVAKAMDIQLVKLLVKNKVDAPLMIDYWVEVFYPNTNKKTENQTSLGLGSAGSSSLLIKLPNGATGEYGIFTDVNSIRGTSKLRADTEVLGAAAWLYGSEGDLNLKQDTIVAIRIMGSEFVPSEGPMENLLQVVLQGSYKRVEVFKVRVRAAP